MKRKSSRVADSPYRVQVLDRALGILDVLSAKGPALSLAVICRELDLHKSTVYRLLMVLERHRLVDKSPENGKYRLGLKLFELGNKTVMQLGLGEYPRSYLERLVLETGETAHVCILDHGEMLSVANVESPRTIRTPSTVGRRTPVHCTAVGKAVLAFLPEREADNFIKNHPLRRFTPNTITSAAHLKAELRLVRERGYAVDDEEIEEGLRCIGAPLRDYSGQVVASMSIAGPGFRITDEKMQALSEAVCRAASQLSAELGYKETASGLTWK